MKRRTRSRNTRLTSEKERRKQYIIKNVVKRGQSMTLLGLTRTIWWASKAVILGALVAGVCWGAAQGYRKLFWDNPDYALQDVPFTTSNDGSLTQKQAIAITGLHGKRNIFSYNLDVARDALRALPQVESVEIRRYLPNRIEIAVTERKPVAWVTSRETTAREGTDHSHLVDASGLFFKPRHVLNEYQSLPVIIINEVEFEDLTPGKKIRTAEISTALELLRRSRGSDELQIVSLDASKGYCIVVTDQRKTQITFGLDDLDAQLHRLAEAGKEAAAHGQILKTVNVMVTRNIPVTFMLPPEPEPGLEELLEERKPHENTAPPARAPKPGQPAQRREPTPKDRSKPTNQRDGERLLRPFRNA